MKKKGFKWDFRAVDHSEYALLFQTSVKGYILKQVFEAGKKSLKEKKSIDVRGDLSNIEKFDIDSRHLSMLGMAKWVRKVSKDVKQDGIIILSDNVSRAWFERNGQEGWDINIEITGQYAQQK